MADVYAKRLQIQEKMAAQIANTINDVVKPQGVGVIAKTTHHCMTTRGVPDYQPHAGLLPRHALTRQEFLGMGDLI